MKKILAGFLLSLLLPSAVHAGDGLANRIETLTRGTQWQLVSSPTLAFDTFHPQGFARAGDSLFMSSVEIIEPTKKFPALQDGFDRDTGKGAGHLFKLDGAGNLVSQAKLGEGDDLSSRRYRL